MAKTTSQIVAENKKKRAEEQKIEASRNEIHKKQMAGTAKQHEQAGRYDVAKKLRKEAGISTAQDRREGMQRKKELAIEKKQAASTPTSRQDPLKIQKDAKAKAEERLKTHEDTDIDWTDAAARQKHEQEQAHRQAAVDQAGKALAKAENEQGVKFARDSLGALSPEEDAALNAYIMERENHHLSTINPMMDNPFGPLYSEQTRALLDKYGKTAVDAMASVRSREDTAEVTKAMEDYGREQAEKGGLHAAAASLLTIPAQAMASPAFYIDAAVNAANGRNPVGGIDPNFMGNVLNRYADSVRGTVAKGLAEKGLAGKAGSWLYQAAMSVFDNAERALYGPVGGAVLAATQSFSRTLSDATEQGATPAQAALLATTNAGIEYLTEKIPLDDLISVAKGTNAGAIIKNLLRNAGIEAATEELSLLGTVLAEAAILRENSAYQQEIQGMIDGGMSPEEAKEEANRGFIDEAINTMIVSGLAGGVGGLGASLRGRQVQADADYQAMQQAQEAETESPAQSAGQEEVSAQEAVQSLAEPVPGPVEAMAAAVVQNKPQTEQVQQNPSEDLVNRAVAGMFGGAESESTAINTDPARHTPEEQATINDYQNSVDENLVEYVEAVRNNPGKKMPKYPLKNVGNRAAQDIKRITGVDVSGNKTMLEPRIVEHILKRHGKDGNADNSMRDVNDIGRIQYVIDNYDTMEDGGRVRAYVTPGKNGKDVPAQSVVIKKKVNGTYFVVEAVPDTKRKTIYITSAYMSKDGKAETAPSLSVDAGAPRVTPDSVAKSDAVSNNSIPESVAQVNGNYNFEHLGRANAAIAELRQSDEYKAMSRNQRVQAEDSGQPIPEGMKGTGAAEQNFSGKAAYADLLREGNVQRDRPGDVRPVEVPKKDGSGRRVTEFAGNAYGAAATPDYMANEIESLIQDGKMGFDTRSNQESLQRAAEALENNTEGVKTQIAENLAKNMVQDGDVEKAMLLYVKNANSKEKADQEAAAQLLVQLGQMSNISGRNLQLFSMLRRMTPEGQLMYAQKAIDKEIARLNKGRSKKNRITGDERGQAESAVAAVTQAREQTEKTVKAAGKRVRYKGGKVTILGNQSGEPFVFEYAQKVGEALAQGIERRANQKPKQKTFLQEIAGELQRFANEKVDTTKQQKRALTATELLRDYIQNQSFYNEAWENAQQALRDKGVTNPKLDEFINSGIGVDANVSAKNKIFAKALAESAMASGETKQMIETQKALGFGNMAEAIADKLIAQTGAIGEMAETIRAAAKDYFLQVDTQIEENPERRSEASIVESKIRAALQDVGDTLDSLARSDRNQKANSEKKIIELLVKKYGFDKADASRVADVVKTQYKRMVKERSQKILEQKFREKKQQVKKTSDQIFDELANLGAFDVESKFNQAAAEKWLDTKDVRIAPELAQEYLNAKTDAEKEMALNAIYMDAAAKIKPTLGEMWDAWRNMAMLMNPKTHIRNIGATGAFQPFVQVKRAIGAGLEKTLLGKNQRTKSVLGADSRSRDLMAWAKADAKNPRIIERMGQTYATGNEAQSKIQEYRKILPGGLDKMRKANMDIMEREDRFFKKGEYARSLASSLKARGYTAQDLKVGTVPGGILEEGRTLAIKEAQKATFNDRNAFSDTVAKLGRGVDKIPVIGKIVSKGALPFLRTPANVVARAWDYSPMKLAQTFYQVHQNSIDAATAIDQVSGALTGTAAMALGVALAAGIVPNVELVGKLEDEDEKENGALAYSLRIGDKYYSVSWLSPTMIPLFIGANLYDKFQALGEENGMDGWDVAQAFMEFGAGVVSPMLELSMLSSLNDAIATFAEEDDPGMGVLAALLNSATSYFTQGLPTIFGQAEQATETEKSSTYVNTDNKVERVIKKALGSASQRIPTIDLFQTPRLDEFGQVVKNEGDALERAFNAFLNPFNVSQKKTDPISQELSRLRKAGAENASIPLPQRMVSYTDMDGEKHANVRLSQEQFQKLAEKQGQTEQTVLSALLDSDDFRAMSGEVKDDVLELVHSYAKETGELAAIENHLGYSATWMEELAEAEDPAKYIVQRVSGTNLNRAMTDLDTAWGHGWNTKAKERALDEAYEEYKSMSKEAQKEIEAFTTGTAKKYLEARGKGISHEDFLAAAKNVETVQGTGKYNSETKENKVRDIDKREAIAKTTGLSYPQIDIIMKAYMPDYDPTDEKPNKTELKYDYARKELGYSPAEYADIYRAYLEHDKKVDKIKEIMKLGYDYGTANQMYKLFQGRVDVVAWAGK